MYSTEDSSTPQTQFLNQKISFRQQYLAELSEQLQILLRQKNLDEAKALLIPAHPADIAAVIEALPGTMQAIAFRLLSKDEAIEVYEHLDASIQQ